jgi:hypothetical protein
MDQYITNTIQFSSNNLWKPIVEYYKEINTKFKSLYQYASDNIDLWQSCKTTVSLNSAKWLEPLVLIYSTPIPITNTTTNLTVDQIGQVTTWLNDNFPPVSSDGNSVLYVQGQRAYVYVVEQIKGTLADSNLIDSITLFSDTLTCTTEDFVLPFSCETKYVGVAHCGEGYGPGRPCSGKTTCDEKYTVLCYYKQRHYDTNYAIAVDATLLPDDTHAPNNIDKKYTPFIEATIDNQYVDVYESENMPCYQYIVKDCKWVGLTDTGAPLIL